VPVRKAPSLYQLRIALQNILPPVWRRIVVPGRLRLNCLHDTLQIVMGWTDSHLHQFEKDGAVYSVPCPESEQDPEFAHVIDSSRIRLDQLLTNEGDSLIYLYDFGDGWRHEVILEKILPDSDSSMPPQCLAGERHCPPEDVGGAHGYSVFLDIIFDPSHEEHESMVRWVGGRFQPEDFSVMAVNQVLSRRRWPRRCFN
jgi:hypothetical protein